MFTSNQGNLKDVWKIVRGIVWKETRTVTH